MTPATSQPAPAGNPPRTGRWMVVAALVGLAVLGAALAIGGGSAAGVIPGLTDPGALTRWGLPIAKVALNAASAVTVGFVLLAVLLPARRQELGRDALLAMRGAAISALVWAAAAAAVHVLTLSDLLGLPLQEALAGQSAITYTASTAQGQAYAAVFVLALAIVPAARLTIGHGGAVAVLCLAVGTLIPPALAGHAGTGDYHHSAQLSLLIHIAAMALWLGGLVAVSWYAARRGPELARVLRAYSPIALGCFVLIAASGVLNSWVRLSSLADLVTSAYGWLLLGKIAVLVALGVAGSRHRARTLPAVGAGRRGSFRRLAAGEIVVMATALGLAVALSRTPPPVPDDPGRISAARALLGFPIPPEPTLGRLISEFYPDAVFGIGCLAAVLLYLAGVHRLRRRGDRWPLGRTASWLVGVGLIAFVQLSGLMTYGMIMMSVHMVQHLILMMVCPIFLVLGGPATLALRALAPAPRGERGLREYLLAIFHSRVVRFLTHPLVALALFVSGPFMVYFTGLFEIAMRDHTYHTLMSLHFLISGYIFYEMLLGIDPLPKRPHYLARMGLQFAALVFHATFGLALMQSARLIAASYYRVLAADVGWLPDLLETQRLAGAITWGFSELPGLLVLGVLLFQWSRSDEREARRFDRREKDAEAQRAAYNAYLARLNERAQRHHAD
jgi:cytochrome c oxidase assembly factor CtaG/putative copper export protein